MISCLSLLIKSEVFEFSKEKIASKIKQSAENPVFALFYTEHCFNCVNIEKNADSFFNRNKNRPNISFTRINCRNTDFCENEMVFRVPFVRIYHGNNENTWGSLNSSEPREWERLVNEHTLAKISKFSSPNVQTFDLTHFHIQTPKENYPDFRKVRKFAKSTFWDHIFTYQINTSINSLDVRAIVSSECQVPGNLNEIQLETYLTKFAYGIDHNHNLYEIQKKKETGNFLMFLHTDPFNSVYRNSLDNISNILCTNLTVGHMQISDESSIFKEFNIHKSDLPIIAYYNKDNKCYYFSKERIIHNIFLSNFIKDSYKCNEIIGGKNTLKPIYNQMDRLAVYDRFGNIISLIHIAVFTIFTTFLAYLYLNKRKIR